MSSKISLWQMRNDINDIIIREHMIAEQRSTFRKDVNSSFASLYDVSRQVQDRIDILFERVAFARNLQNLIFVLLGVSVVFLTIAILF